MTKQQADTAATGGAGQSTLMIAGLAAMVTYLDTTILFVAFPDITDTFGASSPSTLSWVLNAYTILFAALLVPAGKLADRVGHRRAFLSGSAVFTMASLGCGFAPNVESLIAARALQGCGAAVLIPASLALVMAAFPREKLPQVVAIWGAIGAFSAALGPSLGAGIVDSLGWRWAFFLNLPLGVVTIAAGMRHLRESRDASVRTPSALGVVLIALAVGLMAYGVVEADVAGWASAQTAISIGAGLILLVAFVAHQRWTKAPTLDLELFALGHFRWGNLAMFSFSLAFSAMFFGLILFLVNVWGWSILKAGLAVTPGPLLAAMLAPLFGKLAGRIGQRPLIIAGGLLFALSACYRLVLLAVDTSYVVGVALPLALDAVAIALVFPQATSAAAQALPANRRGVGGAVTQAVRQFGGSFGVAITIALIGVGTSTAALLTRFDHVWWVLVAAGLVTAAFASRMRHDPG
jgi:EmrB/QacA subfamily drug resistance transporter